MLLDFLNGAISLETASFLLVGLILAITFHEAAHALVADRLGDLTPRYMGRLTLNPFAHLDPLGTLLILLTRFGWGKPVQFNPLALRNPAVGAALISLAGPTTNFLIAAVMGLLIRAGVAPIDLWAQIALINVILGVFNLVPLAPLDGEKVVSGLLPPNLRFQWAQIQQFSLFLLIFLILSGGPFLIGIIRVVFQFLVG